MRNHIFVFSREKFKNEINNLTEQQFASGAFISIQDPITEFPGGFKNILPNSENVLNLRFHDTDLEGYEQWMTSNPPYPEVLFDDEMANRIWDFVEQNKNAKFWFIHCTAGICRSGAVGEVISEYFGINYHDFKRENPQIKPNVHVKNILKKILYDQNI